MNIEETIEIIIGIKQGAYKHTRMDYSECKAVAKAYAAAAIKEQLKVAAEEAETTDGRHPYSERVVDRESIINCTKIDLK
jgi:hypothetical protein